MSKTDVWMPWYPADYLKRTLHLSLEEDGFYRRALDALWTCDGLPTQEIRLKRILRVTDDEWSRCGWIMSEFFVIKNNFYTQNRLNEEKIKAELRSERARKNGKNGGRPPNNPENLDKTQKEPSGFSKHNPDHNPDHNPEKSSSHSSSHSSSSSSSQSQSQSPEENNKGLVPVFLEKPENVSLQTWEDFSKLRKEKKAPLTKTAFDRIVIEAQKAGWSLENALKESCARGWQSFKAEWVSENNNGGTKNGNSISKARQREIENKRVLANFVSNGTRNESENNRKLLDVPDNSFSESGNDGGES